jgi:hypothetical protein
VTGDHDVDVRRDGRELFSVMNDENAHLPPVEDVRLRKLEESLVPVIVAADGVYGGELTKPVENFRTADVSRMDDGLAVAQNRESFRPQLIVRVGDHSQTGAFCSASCCHSEVCLLQRTCTNWWSDEPQSRSENRALTKRRKIHDPGDRGSLLRRFAWGAEVQDRITSFRVWAPESTRVELELEEGPSVSMDSEPGGYFSTTAEAPAGTLYRFRIDGKGPWPDPASRYQPDGPFGPSMVVDSSFAWTDATWKGVPEGPHVVYEAHIGTLTVPGTYDAARGVLPHLADLGVTILQILPVSDFSGSFGWGYDGVNLWAPTRLYGTPDDLRQLVDDAHRLGIGVILDVVYNHIGPEGSFLQQFSCSWFTDRYENEWGEAINFDGENSGPVRDFFIANAAYWIREFHFDGLRLDATQSIHDASRPHVLAEITDAVRAAAGDRRTWIVAENEPQDVIQLRSTGSGGYGMDALWNDDFHHAAIVALTGRHDAYYSDAEPHDLSTFTRCKLNWAETDENPTLQLHRDLIRLKSTDSTFRDQTLGSFHGSVLADEAFLLRHLRGGAGDRLLIVNLGRELYFSPAPEPLLAPPQRFTWELMWSSESPKYGGAGTPAFESASAWRIPGRAAVVFSPGLEENGSERDKCLKLGRLGATRPHPLGARHHSLR